MAVAVESLDEQLGRLFASDPEVLRDPYPLYRQLREQSPVHHFGPLVLVTKYPDVKMVASDAARFSSEQQREGTTRTEAARAQLSPEHQVMFDEVLARERLFLTQTDDPDHARRRDIARRLFTPKRIMELEARTQEIADGILDSQLERDTADIEWCAYRLPALVISDLLGVPHADADLLVGWGDAIMRNLFGGQGTELLEASFAAHRAFADYVLSMLAEHRSGRHPTELFAALMGAKEEDQLTDMQLTSMFLEMQLGGYETTRILLCSGIYELLTHRDQWDRLVAEPDLAANAADELLRIVSPAQWSARIPGEDVELQGVRISAGHTVMPMFAAANRDPEVFADPDAIDIARSNARQQLGLGFGPHYCIGQALARLEGKIWFATVTRRFPQMELATPPERIRWVGNAINRRLPELEAHLGPHRKN